MMKFGLFGINMGPCSDPVTAVRVAQAAEAVSPVVQECDRFLRTLVQSTPTS